MSRLLRLLRVTRETLAKLSAVFEGELIYGSRNISNSYSLLIISSTLF